jgi:hypothetical protein
VPRRQEIGRKNCFDFAQKIIAGNAAWHRAIAQNQYPTCRSGFSNTATQTRFTIRNAKPCNALRPHSRANQPAHAETEQDLSKWALPGLAPEQTLIAAGKLRQRTSEISDRNLTSRGQRGRPWPWKDGAVSRSHVPALGKPQEVLADLDAVVHEEPRPNRQFHRGLACWRLGQRQDASTALDAARKLGLMVERLNSLERADQELVANLKP